MDDDENELFLPETEDDEPVEGVVFVSIRRERPTVEHAGRSFPVSEFQTADAIRRRFGGGTYVVQGRNSQKQIVRGAKRQFTFSTANDPPRAMTGDEAPAQEQAPAPLPPSAPAPDLAALVQATMMPLITLMQSQREESKAQLAMMQQQTANHLQMMQASATKQVEIMQMFFSQAMQNRQEVTSGEKGMEHFMLGMEHAQKQQEAMLALREEMVESLKKENSEDGIERTVSTFFQGIAMLKNGEAPKTS